MASAGIERHGDLYWNLPPAELAERAVRAGEGVFASNGAFVCTTAPHTGRSPNDKFVVDEPTSSEHIWWGNVNQRMSAEHFDRLHRRLANYCAGRDLYVRDVYAGADPATRLAIRVVNESAWHNLFAAQLFIRPPTGSTLDFTPGFTVLNVPGCKADPATDGTNSTTFIALNFQKRLVLIGGTAYAGEIKKSVFTVMNYVLPRSGVLSMHCSANLGANDDAALFFGLSGTGKTTLSADPERRLIGDDEHGWSDSGIFNIEGGCYAKCIHLSKTFEPQIYNAIRFGAVLENVVIDGATRAIDYDSAALTENTRAAYPLDYIEGAVIPSVGPHPRNVIFLTCDAFGVLPPVSALSAEQAMYHFLSGYTAKVAGTEKGVSEPQATFSTCFGAPFLPLPPSTYANMLGQKLARHGVKCWLVNTGWSGGGYGIGHRFSLTYTRAIVRAILSGALTDVPTRPDPVFGVGVPRSCPDVPAKLLTPRSTWNDAAQYDARARELAGLFKQNFARFEDVGAEIRAAGPVG
ncbi:MAG: phosphoenolpyruvate carboxykinase (ATP) [Phycisphaerales bacterium]|nr:MAG: phosphoenolpyruvate carboxykinase (ATP) [Phycisphaerales bacterium]